MEEQSVKALLISVGGSAESVISAVNSLQPESLCFFVSEGEKGSIDSEIIPRIEKAPRQWDQIVTEAPDDLLKCCRVLLNGLPELLQRWEVDPAQLTVDYTAGTKTMSAALVLCAADHASTFRRSAGEGEHQGNPWDELAIRERKVAARQFNRARYRSASDHFQRIERRVSGGAKPLYKALADLSEGYALWDAFDYQGAWGRLQSAKKALEMAALFGGPPGIKALSPQLKENLAFLEKIAMGSREVRGELFFDLLANADRRARIEQKYEDATVRLYRALEVLAQTRLFAKGIVTGNVDPARLPGSIRETYRQRYTRRIDGKIKIGLGAAYRLLKELGDDLGEAFEREWNNLKAPLDARHGAILAHGFIPVRSERYRQLWETALRLSKSEPRQLPRFPEMEL
jgi:CRISPR-associated protein (TIGR02710 family)